MNTKSLEVVFWLLLLSFIFNSAKWQVIKDNVLFLILMLQYPILNILRIYFAPEHEHEIITAPAEYDMWLYCILGIVLATVFFNHRAVREYAKFFIPLSLILTFTIAAYNFHILYDLKVKLWNANTFEAPLFASTFALIALSLFHKDNALQIFVSTIIITPILVLCLAYAGTRGILIAQLISFAAVIIKNLLDRNFNTALSLTIAIILGLVFGLYIDTQSAGMFYERAEIIFLLMKNQMTFLMFSAVLVSIVLVYFKYLKKHRFLIHVALGSLAAVSCFFIFVMSDFSISNPASLAKDLLPNLEKSLLLASEVDRSTFYRLRLLNHALVELEGNMLLGLGASLEPQIAEDALPKHGQLHLHNNYISWLVWGGVPTLISGLIWLFGPVYASVRTSGQKPALVTFVICALWSTCILFDSFFVWKNFTYVYILMVCLAFQVAKSNRQA